MAKIACLGWGSLIWNPDKLPIRKPWRKDGPLVRADFLRKSGNGRITLVLHKDATPLQASWAEMKTTDVAAAIEALRARERIRVENVTRDIGRWPGDTDCSHLIVDLPAWAQERDVSIVIWTALRPEFFMDEPDRAPEPDDILKHLSGLPREALTLAEEYIRRAPPHIDTQIRRAVADEFGWTPRLEMISETDVTDQNETREPGRDAASVTDAPAQATPADPSNDNAESKLAEEGPTTEGLTSIPEFIKDVVTKARAEDGADAELIGILEEHIVTAKPSLFPVEDALAEIEGLAQSRATGETADGSEDNN